MTELNQTCQGWAQRGQIYARNELVSLGFSGLMESSYARPDRERDRALSLPTALGVPLLLTDKQGKYRP